MTWRHGAVMLIYCSWKTILTEKSKKAKFWSVTCRRAIMGAGLVSLSKMSGGRTQSWSINYARHIRFASSFCFNYKFSLVSALKYMILLLRWLFQEKNCFIFLLHFTVMLLIVNLMSLCARYYNVKHFPYVLLFFISFNSAIGAHPIISSKQSRKQRQKEIAQLVHFTLLTNNGARIET